MDDLRPRRRHPALRFGAAGALALAASVALLGESGAFAPIGRAHALASVPGVTVADDAANAAMPVVTSLRSDGEAERQGVRVGDRIAGVDDEAVRDVAGLDRAIGRRAAPGPVSLHVRRGDAVWTVAIDRADPAAPAPEPHEP